MKNNEIFNVEEIKSKTNSTIVKIAKLSEKKYRKQEELFVCNGIKLFNEAIAFDAKIEYIILKNSVKFEEEIIDKIKEKTKENVAILCVSDVVFDKISEEQAPQGIITICKFHKEKHTFSTIVKNVNLNEKIIILEAIRDPGNIGTIIRNAAAFGIEKLILSSDCVDIYSSKVVRAAMGAIFKVGVVIVEDLQATIKNLKENGRRVYAATLEKNSLVLGKDSLTKRDIVVIGNEGHGISKEIIDCCDNSIFIPMNDNTESLNAAIAATIFMWEMSK